MDIAPSLPDNVLFRAPSPDSPGAFVLGKSILVMEGVNVTRANRCDNLTYSWELPSHGTEFHDDGIYLGEISPYTGRKFTVDDVRTFVRIVELPGEFCISYYLCQVRVNGTNYDNGNHVLFDNYPASLWYGKSIVELLKNMREWSLLHESGIMENHPMSLVSISAFNSMNTPQWVFDELDSLPDMHLSRFLKGEESHREIIDGYPQMSEKMIDWFKSKTEEFKPNTTRDMLSSLVI